MTDTLQDDLDAPGAFGATPTAARGFASLPTTTRDRNDAIGYARKEVAKRSQDWTNYCQKFVRTCWGTGGGFSSAWTQWLGLPDDLRHPGTDPDDAPFGAPLFYKGTGPYGHVTLATYDFDGGATGCYSNDLERRGYINKVARDRAVTQWGQKYLGWGESLNGYRLDLTNGQPPVLIQDKPYKGIAEAIDALGRARDHASSVGDAQDVGTLDAELARLKGLYDTLRRA